MRSNYVSNKVPLNEWIRIYDYIPKLDLINIFEKYRISASNNIEKWYYLYELLNNNEIQHFVNLYEQGVSQNIENNESLTETTLNTFIEQSRALVTQITNSLNLMTNTLTYITSNNSLINTNRSNNRNRSLIENIQNMSTSLHISNNTINTTENSPNNNYANNNSYNLKNIKKIEKQLASAIEKLAISQSVIHPIENYNTDIDPKMWVKKYEKACLINGWADNIKVKFFPKYISDEVITWITKKFFKFGTIILACIEI